MLQYAQMAKFDALIVLGSQPDPITWEFPRQVYDCLDTTKELYDSDVAPLIITSGMWSIALDSQGITQPFKECDALADYLINKGVPTEDILKEGDSKDTISNLYYLKTNLLIPHKLTKLLFVVAEFRIARLQFLSGRILGSDYSVFFEPIQSEMGSTYNETLTLKVQSEFLEPMATGDHMWLKDKFYTAPMYQYWAKHDKKRSARRI